MIGRTAKSYEKDACSSTLSICVFVVDIINKPPQVIYIFCSFHAFASEIALVIHKRGAEPEE